MKDQLFLTNDIWKQANQYLKKDDSVNAVIAYVTSKTLKLKSKDILICDASKDSIKFGRTSAKILKDYFNDSVTIYSIEALHAKLLVSNRFIIIGSANLSVNSAENLIEAAIISRDELSISQTKAFIFNLIKEIKPLTEIDIQDLLEIHVIRSSKRKLTKRRKSFYVGDKIWVSNVRPLSETIIEKEYDDEIYAIEKIRESHKMDRDSLSYIRFKGKSKIRDHASPGDLLIEISTNATKTRTIISGPYSIRLRTDKEDYTKLFFDRNDVQKELSWTNFTSRIKNLNLSRPILKNRTRELSKSDFELIKNFIE